jgi:hypothetical protein
LRKIVAFQHLFNSSIQMQKMMPILAINLTWHTEWSRFWHYMKQWWWFLLQFLFEATTANCVELATDRHGCCVLQKCLSQSKGEQRRCLVSEITSNALILSQDPFGYCIFLFSLSFLSRAFFPSLYIMKVWWLFLILHYSMEECGCTFTHD